MKKSVYVKPLAHAMSVSGDVVLSQSGTEGWNEKPGQGSWHIPRSNDASYEEAGE